MSLKGSEYFVAESLQNYFETLNKNVSFEEGEDPPDVYFFIDDIKIAIEITDLDENCLHERRTIDSGYLSFFNKMNEEFESLINEGIHLHIFFEHNYHKVKIINNKFKKYLKELIKDNRLKVGTNIEDSIDKVKFSIKISKIAKDEKRIEGAIMPSWEPQCVSLNERASSIVKNRIDNKNKKCIKVKTPIWLALYDNYYNKYSNYETTDHVEFYDDVLRNIDDFGVFDKVLIVFENGDVLYLDVVSQ
ncbi:MAG: hypothetical protein L3J43_05650 [Sulfurovum sp.]|nr:hypothetical protein [Sulfurovum sp.]